MSPPTFPSSQGFLQLSRSRAQTMNDAEAIPLQKVVSTQSTGARRPSQTPFDPTPSSDRQNEKGYRFRRGLRKQGISTASKEKEEGALNAMGKLYTKILNFSLVTRYLLYILPLGLILAVPIVIGATVAQDAKIPSGKYGVRIVWFFTWIEISQYTSLWKLIELIY